MLVLYDIIVSIILKIVHFNNYYLVQKIIMMGIFTTGKKSGIKSVCFDRYLRIDISYVI